MNKLQAPKGVLTGASPTDIRGLPYRVPEPISTAEKENAGHVIDAAARPRWRILSAVVVTLDIRCMKAFFTRRVHSGFEIDGLFDQTCGNVGVRDRMCEFEKCYCLLRQILFAHHFSCLRLPVCSQSRRRYAATQDSFRVALQVNIRLCSTLRFQGALRRAEPGAASAVFPACEFAKKTATWFCSSASHCWAWQPQAPPPGWNRRPRQARAKQLLPPARRRPHR
jgi:hypothetical protein